MGEEGREGPSPFSRWDCTCLSANFSNVAAFWIWKQPYPDGVCTLLFFFFFFFFLHSVIHFILFYFFHYHIPPISSFSYTHPSPSTAITTLLSVALSSVTFSCSIPHPQTACPELAASSLSVPPFLFNTFVTQQSLELFQMLFHSFHIVQCPCIIKCHVNTIIPGMFISATFLAWYVYIEFIYHY